MGDMIDDLMDISKSFSSIGDDLTNGFKDVEDEFAGKNVDGNSPRGIREIWDPARFYGKVGMNPTLCEHADCKEATCRRCVEICPVDALTLDDEGNLAIKSDACKGCGLCVAVCPTRALYTAKADPKHIYDQLAASAGTGERAYVTCAQALRKTPPAGVVVLPCLSVMNRELWFAILAAYDNISVYQPVGTCDECPFSAGEELYTEAIATAEDWSRETVGLVCEADKLRFDKKREAQRKEFINSIFKTSFSVAKSATPFIGGAGKVLDAINKHRRELNALQGTLNKLTGSTDAGSAAKRLNVDSNRVLMLQALRTYKDLADDVELDLAETDYDVCDGCEKCITACPTGARAIDEDGDVSTLVNHCVGCGLCEEVCPTGACTLVLYSGSVFLDEMSDLEKKVEEYKDKGTDFAKDAVSKAKETLGGIGDKL